MRTAASQKVQGPALPANFAARLCMKEVQLEQKCTFQLITELVTLYQHAIEYFEAKSDPRQQEYQTRLQKMLIRDDVIQQLEHANHKSSEEPAVTSIASPVIDVDQPIARRRGTMAPASRMVVSAPRPAVPETLLDQHAQDSLKVLEGARKDLKQQHSALLLRLQRRVQNSKGGWKDKSPKTVDSQLPTGDSEMDDSSFEEITEKDFAGEESIASPAERSASPSTRKAEQAALEEMERELNLIVEESIILQTQRVEAIRDEFRQQVRELEADAAASEGGSVMEQVVARMREMMESEVEAAISEVKVQRKERLDALKAKFWSR